MNTERAGHDGDVEKFIKWTARNEIQINCDADRGWHFVQRGVRTQPNNSYKTVVELRDYLYRCMEEESERRNAK